MSEPSMEEILSSIKRIIADDGDGASRVAARTRRPLRSEAPVEAVEPVDAGAPAAELVLSEASFAGDVFELTSDFIDAPTAPAAAVAPVAAIAAPRSAPAEAPTPSAAEPVLAPAAAAPVAQSPVVSEDAAAAARQSLSQLSSLLIRPDAAAPSNTLEGLVQDMLRPMLKEWLDANLPDIVERKVAAEIARISGRVG